jgi:hypothetical protein
MRLSVEIKDGEWKYEYQIGEQRGSCSRHIDADTLCAFTDLLKFASNASRREQREFDDMINAKAWIEKNPTEAKATLEKLTK